MTDKIQEVCRTCKWADWQYTPTGRVKHDAGKCRWPEVTVTVPIVVDPPSFRKKAIWPDYDTECPCWKPND